MAPYQEWILLRAPEVGYNARVLYRELKEKGSRGGYDLTKKYLPRSGPKGSLLKDFYKSMTREVSGQAWQDVYRPQTPIEKQALQNLEIPNF